MVLSTTKKTNYKDNVAQDWYAFGETVLQCVTEIKCTVGQKKKALFISI